MAAMTTALTEFADSPTSRTYTTTGHTVLKPKLVIQKRKIPSNSNGNAESRVAIVHATEDSDGEVIANRVAFEAVVRMPLQGDATDQVAALAIFRDIIAGDEFGNTVTTQEWLS